MPNIVQIQSLSGNRVEFVDRLIGRGGMKDVYFSSDKSYVVAFYRDEQDAASREHLQNIVGKYRTAILEGEEGNYWKNLFCWPTDLVEWNGMLGIVAPTYGKEYFFEHGSVNNDMLQIRGKEKNGKWFVIARHRQKFLDPRELGNWSNYLRICLQISRGVHRLHASGLSHSDLSCNNVLVNPVTGSAIIIDIDSLVVPGKYPAVVLGTPGFIAPEVMRTKKLPSSDSNRILPSQKTNLHSLAVMIYSYLLYRHPLEGGKVHDEDLEKDLEYQMGERALFIEHPTDTSNRPNTEYMKSHDLPWGDVEKIPYTVAGPYLKELFDKAFIDGLHQPDLRPSASQWAEALSQTLEMLVPCSNPSCEQRWYVSSSHPDCPFCEARQIVIV